MISVVKFMTLCLLIALTRCDQDVHGRVVATIPVIHSVPDLLVNLEVLFAVLRQNRRRLQYLSFG